MTTILRTDRKFRGVLSKTRMMMRLDLSKEVKIKGETALKEVKS